MVRRGLRVRRNMAVACLAGGVIAASLFAPAAAQNEPVCWGPLRRAVIRLLQRASGRIL